MFAWLRRRNPRYLATRLFSLLGRYGLTGRKGKRRVNAFVTLLGERGCRPTFAIPGRVMARHPTFCRDLVARGVELAVHGHEHVDFRTLSPPDAASQFARAVEVFEANEISTAGFRCPYLSLDERVLESVPPGVFEYSSNEAISWTEVPALADAAISGPVFQQLLAFYQPSPEATTVALPRVRDGLIEIPVSVPDDLQLLDGLKLTPEEIGAVWSEMLRATHQRGWLFAPLFHPEAVDRCRASYEIVLDAAGALDPPVWIARLDEISSWWKSRHEFSALANETAGGLELRLTRPARGRVVGRGLGDSTRSREGAHQDSPVDSDVIEIAGRTRPFVRVSRDVASRVRAQIEEDGYIVEVGDGPHRCALSLERTDVEALGSDRALLDYLDTAPGPLVRLARWPDGAQSALCLSGDLDAVSLRDYAARLLGR